MTRSALCQMLIADKTFKSHVPTFTLTDKIKLKNIV